jgi:hypothetical protein
VDSSLPPLGPRSVPEAEGAGDEGEQTMKELRTEIDIQASADRVWECLTDFASFPSWNPFIRWVKGEARVGTRLVVHLQPSGANAMTFKPIVLTVSPPHELRWLGRLFLPGIFDGEHILTIDALEANRVRFTQREFFNGLLVPFLAHSLDTNTRRGFEEMNQALKLRAEQKVANG